MIIEENTPTRQKSNPKSDKTPTPKRENSTPKREKNITHNKSLAVIPEQKTPPLTQNKKEVNKLALPVNKIEIEKEKRQKSNQSVLQPPHYSLPISKRSDK